LKGKLFTKKRLLTLQAVLCAIAAIVTLVCVSTACSPANTGTTSATPIKIGGDIPLTGATSDTGKIMNQAMQLAVEQAGGKVAGRPIQLVVLDTAADQNQALSNARQMVQAQGVNIMILDPLQSISGALSAYLETVPAIGVNCGLAAVPPTQLGWTLYAGGEGYQSFTELGYYCAKVLGWKTVTTIGSDFVSGHSYTDTFIASFTKNGGTVIQSQWSPLGVQDYGPFLTGMKQADGVMSAVVIPQDALAFRKQYTQFGMKMPVAVGTGAFSQIYLQQLGDASLGMYGTMTYTRMLTNKQNTDFVAAYKAKFGAYPEYEAASTYAAMQMILAALDKTKGDSTPAVLRAAILTVKADTARGPISFSPEGSTYNNIYAVKSALVDGQYVWQVAQTFTNVPPKGH